MGNSLENGGQASKHLWLTCPKCKRSNLRIRPENVGQLVLCKHCGRRFLAQSAVEPQAAGAALDSVPDTVGKPVAPADKRKVEGLKGEVRHSKTELNLRDSEYESASEELGKKDEQLAQFKARIVELESKLKQSQEQVSQALGLRMELDAAGVEIDRLRAEADALRAKATESEWIREIERSEIDRQNAEFEATRARFEQFTPEAFEALQRELKAAESEREQLRDELLTARAAIDTQRAEAAQIDRLTAELDASRVERDRITAEREQAVLGTCAVEGKLLEVQAASAQAIERHNAAEAALTRELAIVQERSETERRAALERESNSRQRLAEAEHLLTEARAQAESEHQDLRAQFQNVGALRETEVQSLRAECSQLREQIAAESTERAVLHQQVESLGTEQIRWEALAHEADLARQELAHEVDLARQELAHEVDLARQELAAQHTEVARISTEKEQLRLQVATADQLNTDLEGQLQGLRAGLRQLEIDRDREAQEHDHALTSMAEELNSAHSVQAQIKDQLDLANAAFSDLERRLAETLSELSSATETSHRLESELQSEQNQARESQQAAVEEHPAVNGDMAIARSRIEQLDTELQQARGANERLRSILRMFGITEHLDS